MTRRSLAPPGCGVSRRFEDRHIVGRYLNRLAGLGIAVRAGLAVPHLDGTEAPELDAVASGERVLQDIEEGVNQLAVA